ncbi:hypothetical protein [Streptomyces sp. MH13]|uniref:hypothetical protein n=1 Tax=Streptomyces sp. MH13 TaxID=3417651 RepID=UPI003CEF9EB6
MTDLLLRRRINGMREWGEPTDAVVGRVIGFASSAQLDVVADHDEQSPDCDSLDIRRPAEACPRPPSAVPGRLARDRQSV